MVQVIFFEKPGCTNNTRQKQWLRERGVVVVAVDLLDHPWSEGELLAYFDGMPVSEWFNRSAPRVKSGEIVPEQLTPAAALQLLLQEPLLIRRPLLRQGGERRVGFDGDAIARWLGVRGDGVTTKISEECPRPDKPCVSAEER